MTNHYLNNELIKKLRLLHYHHYEKCDVFKKIIDELSWYNFIEDDPAEIFLHTSLFKENEIYTDLKNDEQLLKLHSSGTSGNRSVIFTDRHTRIEQQRALQSLVLSELNISLKQKPSYYVIDNPNVIKDSKIIDARYAAIKGFSSFGKGINFLLDEDSNINFDMIDKLSSESNDILIFGFTGIVYTKFLKYLESIQHKIYNNSITLLHGGGWKKLISKGVSNKLFKELAINVIPNVICKNYYGMIEQTGSIFFECDEGFLHSNQYGGIILRNNNLAITSKLQQGIIQSISILPKSYPGHSLLTEDMGIIYGIDDCKCGRPGTYFHVQGRLSRAIVRGCSDVY